MQEFTVQLISPVLWAQFFISITSGIIAALFQHFILGAGVQRDTNRQRQSIDFSQVNRIHIQTTSISRQTTHAVPSDNNWFVYLCLVLTFLAVLLPQYQETIITWSLLISTMVFGYWVFVISWFFYIGVIGNFRWIVYLVTVCVLQLAILPILSFAIDPIYAPEGIQNAASIAKADGLVGLLERYGINGFFWLVYQVVGFLLLYLAEALVVLSLVFYTSYVALTGGYRGQVIHGWILKKTVSFYGFNRLASAAFIFLISFLLLSGTAYKFLLWIQA